MCANFPEEEEEGCKGQTEQTSQQQIADVKKKAEREARPKSIKATRECFFSSDNTHIHTRWPIIILQWKLNYGAYCL